MKYKEQMPITKIIEHPENKRLFKDIKDTNPTFWIEFLDSIERFGIIEPLIVNSQTMQIRSGNQRYLAAIELGLEKVPVLLQNPELETDEDLDEEARSIAESNAEIQKMIASNVYRRTIDPFSMIDYIGRLRFSKKSLSTSYPQKTIKEVVKQTHKSTSFVGAADIFNALPKEQQEAIKEWFNKQAEGEKAKSEGTLISEIARLKASGNGVIEELEEERTRVAEAEEELENERALLAESQEQIESITYDLTEVQEKLDAMQIDLEDAQSSGSYEELQEKEADIEKLLQERAKLKAKIKELKDTPDLSVLLIDCVSKQLQINSVLKEVLENADSLNTGKLAEFEDAIKRTFKIIKDAKNNDQNDRRMEISD